MNPKEYRPKHWAIVDKKGETIDWDAEDSKEFDEQNPLYKPSKKKARRHPVTDETVFDVLEAIRVIGWRPSKVANATGLDVKWCRKLYREGMAPALNAKPTFHGCRPLQDVILEEQALARARMVDAEAEIVERQAKAKLVEAEKEIDKSIAEKEAELALAEADRDFKRTMEHDRKRAAIKRRRQLQEAAEKAHDDIIESRALRGRSIRAARTNAIALQSVVGQLLKSAIPLTEKIATLLEEPKWRPNPSSALRIVRAVAWMTREANQSAQIADEMERRALGEPDQILALEHTQSLDESVAIIMEAHAAMERASKRGTVTPIAKDAKDVLTVETTDPGLEKGS